MNYSDTALAFSTIPASSQIRLEDRISFLYLEYCQVRQDKTGVIVIKENSRGEGEKSVIQLPVGGICVLMLGPGTSVSNPAMTSLSRSGVSVLFSGGGGYPMYSLATPLTTSSKWTMAQARAVVRENDRRKVARLFYEKQLGVSFPSNYPISKMRGLEGSYIKCLYRSLSSSNGIKGFRRDVTSEDNVNVSLNVGNSILYGLALSVISCFGMSPALGVIHQGSHKAFVLDLADIFKPIVSIPVAFNSYAESDPVAFTRKRVREEISRNEVALKMIETVQDAFAPHVRSSDNQDTLIVGKTEEDVVFGHTNYGGN